MSGLTDCWQVVANVCRKKYCVTSSSSIIRLNLQAFLNSKLCKEQLKAKVVGAVMTILSIGKIKEIDIPIPAMEQQIAIGKRYKETQLKIATLKKIVELEAKRNDIQFINMVK